MSELSQKGQISGQQRNKFCGENVQWTWFVRRTEKQTVVETEVHEKWPITEGFNYNSVITRQMPDFPSFILALFLAAAFLQENKTISFRQYNARNNRFGQTFAEAWWGLADHYWVPLQLLSTVFSPRWDFYSSTTGGVCRDAGSHA